MVKEDRIEGRKGNAARAARRIATCLLVAAATLASAGEAATVEKEGMRYEDTARVAGTRTVLNGVGVRGNDLFKGYVAGLYLPHKETEAEQVYALQGAKRISVRMLLGVNGDVLARTFSDGIRKNYKDDALDVLKARMDVFDSQVRAVGGVKKGDAIDLDFEPASGTRLLVNGKPQGDAIAGDDFYVALLKMFIGERAIDKGLRSALLGQRQ